MDPLQQNGGFFLDASPNPFSPSSRQETAPSSAAGSTHPGLGRIDDFHFDFDQTFSDISAVSLAFQKPSHDDDCLSGCPAGINGFPYHQPASTAHRGAMLGHNAHGRQRHSVSSVPCTPYLGAFSTHLYSSVPPRQLSHAMPYSAGPVDFDFKLPSELDHKPGHLTMQNVQQLAGGDTCNPSVDMCHLSSCPVVDDCASVNCSIVSCSEQCCPQACHDDSCADGLCQDEACAEGTPCDNVDCLDFTLPDHFDPMWHAHHEDWTVDSNWKDHMTTHDSHACNHTNAEHDVAVALRNLKAPSDTQPQQQQLQPQNHLTLADFGGVVLDGLSQSQPDLTYASTVNSSPQECKASECTNHCCQWLMTGADGQEHVCGKTFDGCEELNNHLCDDHITLTSSKTKYLCSWKGCNRREDQVFASRNKLRRHIATHTCYKPHQCATCGERFSAKQALDQHERTHTGDKPYTCPYDACGKSFKQKSALTMHIRTHTGEKPLTCEICGKSFCESSNLSKHRKTHNPDYKYKCDEPGCDSQFIRIDQLRRHQAKHVRQKKKGEVRGLQQAMAAQHQQKGLVLKGLVKTEQQMPVVAAEMISPELTGTDPAEWAILEI